VGGKRRHRALKNLPRTQQSTHVRSPWEVVHPRRWPEIILMGIGVDVSAGDAWTMMVKMITV